MDFVERPAEMPGEGKHFRWVCYPGRGKSIRGHILCPRPRQYRCHYSPLLGRTFGCMQPVCWACRGELPLVHRDYLFLPMLVQRPRQEMVIGLQVAHALPIWQHPETGDYWRGLTIQAERGQGKYDEVKVTVLGRVPDDFPLPDPWDVSVDLWHVWENSIPRQWDGRLTPPPPPRVNTVGEG